MQFKDSDEEGAAPLKVSLLIRARSFTEHILTRRFARVGKFSNAKKRKNVF